MYSPGKDLVSDVSLYKTPHPYRAMPYHTPRIVNRAHRVAFNIFAIVAVLVAAFCGCFKNDPLTPPSPNAPIPPSQRVIDFVDSTAIVSSGNNDESGWMDNLDNDADQGHANDVIQGQAEWDSSRHYYERIRFAYEGFGTILDRDSLDSWFNSEFPKKGFHYIETLLWKPIVPQSEWYKVIEPATLIMWSGDGITAIQGVIQNSNDVDTKIFTGLLGMLAYIENVDFTKLDSAYSRNTLNDVFSNLEGLDR